MKVSDLIGMTMSSVTRGEYKEYSWRAPQDAITFVTDTGRTFQMYHQQDCCESVTIEDICGDLNDLVGSPILMAEEVVSNENPEGVPVPSYQDSFTWTFYKFATVKGYVTIRWYGDSNGYYSESVDFVETTANA